MTSACPHGRGTRAEPEVALAQATEATKRYAEGWPLGPLDGVPIGLKDNYDTAGLVTACGCHALRDRVPQEDARAVTLLREAGAVLVGIETDRGPWVAALIAAGYEVFAINPMSVARYRERHSTSGGKSDAGDAHVLGEIVRLDRAHHRPVAGDSARVEGLKMVARTHQTLVWDRTRHVQRLRQAALGPVMISV